MTGFFSKLISSALLKYTEAVLLEVQRLGSVAPFAIPHTNYTEMEIDGYQIPPRSVICMNTFSMHRDPRYFKYPDDGFHPENFLDDENSIVIPQGFVPFGVGEIFIIGLVKPFKIDRIYFT